MANSNPGPPTKTIIGPNGYPIHYPDLPNVGEPYQKPEPFPHDASMPQPSSPPTQSAVSPSIASESWHDRVMSEARSAVECAGAYGLAAVQALVLEWRSAMPLTSGYACGLKKKRRRTFFL